MSSSQVIVGRTELKNPLIAGSAEHLIEADGVRCALRAGAGAVVVKSTNNSQASQRPIATRRVPGPRRRLATYPLGRRSAREPRFIACRSGLTPQASTPGSSRPPSSTARQERSNSYAVASLIFDDLESAVRMARAVEQAGLRVLELNIGTPYASQAAKHRCRPSSTRDG